MSGTSTASCVRSALGHLKRKTIIMSLEIESIANMITTCSTRNRAKNAVRPYSKVGSGFPSVNWVRFLV